MAIIIPVQNLESSRAPRLYFCLACAMHNFNVFEQRNHPREACLEVITMGKLLYFGSIRMNILMLDTRNVEQTKDVRMYT